MTPSFDIPPPATLPHDGTSGALAGRIWRPELSGPSIVAIRADGVFDITSTAPSMTALAAAPTPAAVLSSARGERVGALADILANTPVATRDRTKPCLLSPLDLQVIKA